jgi:hypothetical protein
MSTICKEIQIKFRWCLMLMVATIIVGIGTITILPLAIAIDVDNAEQGRLDCRQFQSDPDRAACLRLRLASQLLQPAAGVLDTIDQLSGRPPAVRSLYDGRS